MIFFKVVTQIDVIGRETAMPHESRTQPTIATKEQMEL